MPGLFSLLVLALIGAGIRFRRRPRLHWPLMLTAFALDLGMVVYLEATRSAVESAAISMDPLVWAHATISVGVLGLWLMLLRLGWLMLHGRPAMRHTHRLVAAAFVTLRLANVATSLALPHDPRPAETVLHR